MWVIDVLAADGMLAEAVARYKSSALAMIRGKLSLTLAAATACTTQKYMSLCIDEEALAQDGAAADGADAVPLHALWVDPVQ